MLNSWIELGLAVASVNASTGRGDDRAFAFGDVFRVGIVANLRRAGIPTELLLPSSALVAGMNVTSQSDLDESCLVVGSGGVARVVPIAALSDVRRVDEMLVVVVFLGALHDEVVAAAAEWAFKERPRRGRKPSTARTSGEGKQRDGSRFRERPAKRGPGPKGGKAAT